jgi:cellulose synthase/poly-beta-1,6-N-acetylglucosamine synthase-like glycosyltransferase
MALARSKASAEYLFFTDADAKIPAAWLSRMLCCQQNSAASMVCSEVEIVNRGGLLNLFEALEQAALVAFSASAVANGKAFLCNGAGYLVIKQAFGKITLAESWHRSPGGDDVILLHAMHEAGEKIAYCRLDGTRVQLEPAGISEFFWQRIRWASKIFLGNSAGNLFPALFVWLFHLLSLRIFTGILLENGLFGIFYCFLASFFIRGIWEAILVSDFISPGILRSGFSVKGGDSVSKKNGFVKKTDAVAAAGMCSILAPFYSLYVVLAGPLLFLFRSFSWKGRSYSTR